MPDPLLGDEQLIGEWDSPARLLVVTGWVAGPAGSAGVDFDGIELDVDVAAPGRTCQLLVPAGPGGGTAAVPPAARAALHRLLGDARTVALLNLSRSHLGRPVVLSPALAPHAPAGGPEAGPDPSPPKGLPEPGRPSSGGVDPRLARLALARMAAEDDDIPAAARAVGQLEAALAAADLPADLGLASAVASGARAGAEALLAATGELGWLDPVTAFRLTALFRRIAALPGTAPGTAQALAHLAAGLDLAPATDAPTAAPAPTSTPAPAPTAAGVTPAREAFGLVSAAPAEPFAAAPLRMATGETRRKLPAPELDAASATGALPDGPRPTLRRSGRHEIEVSLARPAGALEGVWVRVVRRADGVLLALAPFRPAGAEGAGARARLLVPDEESAALLVDLTFDPGAPIPSAARLGVEAALAAGRRAARAQRLGQRGTAITAWRDCRQAWSEAGDDRRAAMAAEYADLVLAQAVPTTTEPLVSDRLA